MTQNQISETVKVHAKNSEVNARLRDAHRLIAISGGTKIIAAGVLTLDPDTTGGTPVENYKGGAGSWIVEAEVSVEDTVTSIVGLAAGDIVKLTPATDETITFDSSQVAFNFENDLVLAPDKNVVLYYDGAVFTVIGGTIDLFENIPTSISGAQLVYLSDTQIRVTTSGKFACENGDIGQIKSPETITLTAPDQVANAWIHVYASVDNDGETSVGIIRTSSPVKWAAPHLHYGTAYSVGGTNRRYLGSFLLDGSADIYPFEHNNESGQIRYKLFPSGSTPFRVLSGGTSAVAASISCTGTCPNTAQLVNTRVSNTADQSVSVSEDSNVGISQNSISLAVGSVARQSLVDLSAMDASLNLWYKFTAAVGSGSLLVDIVGYTFLR